MTRTTRNQSPEQKARENIDVMLEQAGLERRKESPGALADMQL